MNRDNAGCLRDHKNHVKFHIIKVLKLNERGYIGLWKILER